MGTFLLQSHIHTSSRRYRCNILKYRKQHIGGYLTHGVCEQQIAGEVNTVVTVKKIGIF